MKGKRSKKLVAVVLMLMMVVLSSVGCSKSEKKAEQTNADQATQTQAPTSTEAVSTEDTTQKEEVSEEPKIIRWGWHNMKNLDPYCIDEATGEYTMPEAKRQASIAALEKVKEELNVEVEYINYTQDVRSELITSVLAGNPVCDIAGIWGGAESTILAQNILQELDDYAYLFEAEEDSWMLYDKIYGHNYFLTWKQTFFQRWPLVYNISMIEKVDTLKDEAGNTIYPTDLFFDGKWTFSSFKDYLSKINAYYANVTAPDNVTYSNVQAYETDWRFAALSATYAAGGSIYGVNGLEVDSPASIKAAEYISSLKESKLMVDCSTYDDGFIPQWTKGGSDFQNGGSVFTDCPDWMIAGSASAAAERGESIGIIPYPRPDDMAFEDENYRQAMTVSDSIGILKGVDKETTELALKFWALYWKTYYEVYGGVEDITTYKQTAAATEAAGAGFDIFHEICGDDVLKAFIYNAEKCVGNDYSDLIGVRGTWDVILGKGMYGIDGVPAYDVAIKAQMSEFTNKISEMETILSSNDIRDNIAPSLEQLDTLAFSVGTDPATIDWPFYFKSVDAVEGDLDTKMATFDATNVDFSTIGMYSGGLIAAIADSSENTNKKNLTVMIYNPENTAQPTITVKEEYRRVTIDEDVSTIKWGNDFVATAVDADGLDIKGRVTADLSEIDATTPGEYNVELSVTDFVGNESKVSIVVTVAKAE